MTVKILVPVSGGKDSQACLKLAVMMHGAENVRGLFCDTQFEHPVTYAHVEKLRSLYGPVRIDRVCDGSVEDQCRKHGRFPGGGARFCTEELKIRPTKYYCRDLAALQGGFEVWYGMRIEESVERAVRYDGKVCDEVYPPHEVLDKYPKYLAKMGVVFRLAVLHWTKQYIFDFLEGEHNPLYDDDFDRIGCFPCLAGGDASKEKAFNFDAFGASQHQKVIKIKNEIGKNIFTSKGGRLRNGENDGHVCAVCAI